MANYFVIGNTFRPYSFDELIKPYQIYGQAYQAIENQYADLSEKANTVEGMANEQSDPEAYKRYKSYADDLRAQADALATQGLTPQARTSILGLRSRYQSEITPIEAAYNRRAQLSDEQRKARLADSSLIFDTDAATISLDELIANPSATYNSLSGADIAKRTGEMATQVAEAMLSAPQYKSIWEEQYVQQMIQQGYTPAQVLAAAQNDPNAPAELKGIKDAIKAEVGFEDWDEANQARIEGYINQGLEKAVGKPKIDIMRDYSVSQQLEREQLQLQRDRFNFEIGREKGVQTPEEKLAATESAKLATSLAKVTNVKAMVPLGYEPIGTVILKGTEWIGGKEGEDMPGHRADKTKSNLRSKRNIMPDSWFTGSGDFSYKPLNTSAETHVVTDLPSIPGFNEFIALNRKQQILEAIQAASAAKNQEEVNRLTQIYNEEIGNTLDEEQMSKTAFGQILQQAARSGIDPVEFLSSNNYVIVKVKARGKRALSDTPWDYIIYKKS